MQGIGAGQDVVDVGLLGGLAYCFDQALVQAVVDLYGPTDLLKMDEQKLPCYPGLSANAWYMPPSLLMGCAIQSCAEKTTSAVSAAS